MHNARPIGLFLFTSALLVAACGGSSSTSTDSSAVSTTAPVTATSGRPSTATTAEPGSTSTSSSASASTATTSGGATPTSCTEDGILPVVKAEIDQPPDLVTASVTIKACKNGYAQVFAVPTQPDRYQAEQLFLKDDGGTWIVVGSGTGIDCDDPEGIDAATQAACAALR